jgi:uncharacterized protein DUF4154
MGMAILRRRSAAVAGTLTALHLCLHAGAQPRPSENEIKAAFLYNFAKYVEWPDATFQAGEFHLCALADAEFLKSVDDIIAGESIAGRPVSRQTASTPDEAQSCHILFVARADLARAEPLLAAARSAHVLTVGEGADFLKRGGAIAFVRDDTRVRFDVNVAEAQRAGLRISSRLLRVARRVSPAGTQP